MQHHAANQLHVKMAHTEHALGRLTDNSKGIRQDLIEDGPLIFQGASCSEAILKGCRLGPQLVV